MIRRTEARATRLGSSLLLCLLLGCVLPACAPHDVGDAATDTANGATCAPGEIDDGGACVPESCGTGPWGDLPDSGVVYVDGRADGDGSRESPLRSIQEALEVAQRRNATVVALADGTYAEGVDFVRGHDGITLHGRCSARVILDAGGLDRQLAMQFYAPSGAPTFGASGLTLRGADVGGLRVRGATVTLRDVRLEGLSDLGMQLEEGSDVTLEDVVVTGTRASRGGWAEGLRVTDDAQLLARGLRIEDSVGVGIYMDGAGARATFEDLVVRGLTRERGPTTAGLAVFENTEATLVGGSVEAPEDGVAVSVPGGTLVLRGTELTGGAAASPVGAGLDVREGGVATLSGVSLSALAGFGVYALGEGTRLDAEDVTLTGVVADARNSGRGVEVNGGARATLSRVTVREVTDTACFVGGGDVHIEDSTLSDTREREEGGGGRGVEVGTGGTATLRGSRVTDNVEVGVFVGNGSELTLDDVDLAFTHARADGRRGVGLEVIDSVATVTGSRITGNQLINLLVAGDSQVDLIDTELRDTRGNTNGGAGWGVQASDGARLTMTGGGVYESAAVGVFLANGASGVLRDVEVADTYRLRGVRSAAGVMAYAGANVTIEGGTVRDNEGPGLAVYGADADVVDTTLVRNTYAAVAVHEAATVTIEGVRIEDTVQGADGGTLGILVESGAGGRPNVTVRDASIGPHSVAGVWITGPGSLTLEDSEISVGAGTPRGALLAHGNAVFATGIADDESALRVNRNRFHGEGGVPVLLHHATGVLGANAWETAPPHVVQQDCNAVDPASVSAEAIAETCRAGNRLVDLSYQVPALYLGELELDE